MPGLATEIIIEADFIFMYSFLWKQPNDSFLKYMYSHTYRILSCCSRVLPLHELNYFNFTVTSFVEHLWKLIVGSVLTKENVATLDGRSAV